MDLNSASASGAALSLVGVRDNQAMKTRNSGSNSIAAGAGFLQSATGLNVTPDRIPSYLFIWRRAPGGVSSIGSTTFTIAHSGGGFRYMDLGAWNSVEDA